METLQARILEWVAMLPSRGSFQHRDWTQVYYTVDTPLPSEPPGKPRLWPSPSLTGRWHSPPSTHENRLASGKTFSHLLSHQATLSFITLASFKPSLPLPVKDRPSAYLSKVCRSYGQSTFPQQALSPSGSNSFRLYHFSLSLDLFSLWCWLECGLLRVPWTARRSNQSILKEINAVYSLEGLMLKLKLQSLSHLMQRVDSLEKTLMLGKIEGGRRGGDRGWGG